MIIRSRYGLISLILTMLIGLTVFFGSMPTRAQSGGAEQAVAIAAAHPAFAPLLDSQPGWKGGAYFTHNAFAIWRVDFWDTSGESLGWAHVNLEKGLVYSWESYYRLSDAQKQIGQKAVADFIRGSAEVKTMLGDLDLDEIYIEYNPEWNVWFGWSYQQGTTIEFRVQFGDESRLSYTQPTLLGVSFPDVISYPEWLEGQKADAITVAFTSAEIAGKVRAHEGWRAEAVSTDEGVFVITFKAGDQVIGTVTVNLTERTILESQMP
ncbi:MAG: hypothetical protein IT322_05360 [Anaerolineae bacterium]|nr:hypothetical protein [Anaerolineae bacterium]